MIDKTLIERKIQLLESHKKQLEALLYEQIDPNIVYSAYQKRLDDFGQYIQSILKFLSKT